VKFKTTIVAVLAMILSATAYTALRSALAASDVLDLNPATATVHQRFSDVPHFDTATIKAIIGAAEPGAVQIVDVREPDEFAVSHIPGAINVPSGTADTDLLAAVSSDGLVILYCSIGFRSSSVARRLKSAGRTNVYNYAGSIFAWANAGQTLQSNKSTATKVHPYNSNWGRYLRPEYRAP
jgi:rhodanese-related sulfurtransferase